MRGWFNQTFKDGEGRWKTVALADAFLVSLTLIVVLLALVDRDHLLILAAWLVLIGYALGVRVRRAPTEEYVPSVAPPFVPGEDG